MNKAAFLDRDGTINIDKDYLYRIEDFEYLPGAIDGLRLLQDRGYLLIIITNQSGIARGIYEEEDYLRLDAWMKEDLANKGISITASYYCPHLVHGKIMQFAMDCDCRKPKPGMFYKAASDWNIDIDNSIAIGDRLRDLSICEETECKGILLSESEPADGIPSNIYQYKNWEDFNRHYNP